MHAGRFAAAIKKAIKDPEVRKIKTVVGAIDQFTDRTDVVENLALCRRLGAVYNVRAIKDNSSSS